MPRPLGDRRHVPDRLFDTWIYKVKDVEFEQPEYVKPGDDDEDERGRDTRNSDEKYVPRKQRVKNKIVEIKVYYIKKTKQSEEPPHPTEEVKFEVKCKELKLDMEGTDIEHLKAAVWDRLDEKFKIKWEGFYLVEVERNHPWGGYTGAGIMFKYDHVYRGTTWDGKLLLKRYEGHEFKIKPWPGDFTDKGGHVIACIPETELNKSALENFCARMDELRKVMADYLKPEVILKTLANLSQTMPFLPAPKEEPKENETAQPAIDV